MKQEDKDLLLKDLCSRLPYGVMVKDKNGFYIKEVKKHWFSSWKIVTTIHLGTTIPQLYRKEDNNYIPI